MPLKKYLTWDRLIGARVEIRQCGRHVRTGIVDNAMPDSSALWLAPEGVHPRTMYEASLLYEAWVEPQVLTGSTCYRMTSSMLYLGQPQLH